MSRKWAWGFFSNKITWKLSQLILSKKKPQTIKQTDKKTTKKPQKTKCQKRLNQPSWFLASLPQQGWLEIHIAIYSLGFRNTLKVVTNTFIARVRNLYCPRCTMGVCTHPPNANMEEPLRWQPVFPLLCDKLLASDNSCSISTCIHLAITNTLRRSRAVSYKDLISCKLDSALKPRAISDLWDPLFILNWLLRSERTISECHFQSTQGSHFSVPFVSVKIFWIF